jgi:hypothetical protein
MYEIIEMVCLSIMLESYYITIIIFSQTPVNSVHRQTQISEVHFILFSMMVPTLGVVFYTLFEVIEAICIEARNTAGVTKEV